MRSPVSAILIRTFACTLLAVSIAACGSDAATTDPGTDPGNDPGQGGDPAQKNCDFVSTYEAIQATVFDGTGCTASSCHGEAALGGLDLREGTSYDALVRQPSTVDPETLRVFPGDQEFSLLYLKLDAGTNGTDLGDLGQPMPSNADPISEEQLEAIRMWIRGGAPEDTIVGSTLDMLGCEGDFDPDPNKISPLPVPAPDEGVQFYAGGWDLGAEAEDEVCFASYYDFRDQVPAEYRVDCPQYGEGRECFAFRRNELAQDGQSHHSIIDVFTPQSDPNGGEWGPWACLGGERAGETCDPTEAGACGERSQCTTPPVTSIGCILYPYAPREFATGGFGGGSATTVSLNGAQESTAVDLPPEGVYSLLPLDGFISWNSHGFNLTKKATTIEQWVNLNFAGEDERVWLRRAIFEAGNIFAMGPIAPFEKEEVCMTWTLPQNSQLLSLSSHMHQRGELFRIWLPPNAPCNGTNCSAPLRDADYLSRLYDDPLYTYYEPPVDLSGTSADGRTFLACAVYDNGADDPSTVKRESTKPNTPTCGFPQTGCGCPAAERSCFGGPTPGLLCNGDDSLCGEGGMCDACPLEGGFTTDDEMFLPLGSFYVKD